MTRLIRGSSGQQEAGETGVQFCVVRIAIDGPPIDSLSLAVARRRFIGTSQIGQDLHVVGDENRATFERCGRLGPAASGPIGKGKALLVRRATGSLLQPYRQ